MNIKLVITTRDCFIKASYILRVAYLTNRSKNIQNLINCDSAHKNPLKE